MTSRAIEMPSAGSSTPAGLTQAEAERRLARYGRNEVAPRGLRPSTAGYWPSCAIR